MKIRVDVTSSKADFILELLNNFPFVKAKSISSAKARLLEKIKEAVENINLVKHETPAKIDIIEARRLMNEEGK